MRRRLLTRLRYLTALLWQFRVTVVLASIVYGILPWVVLARFPAAAGTHISYGEAFHHVYFLLLDGPSLPYVDDGVLEAVNLIVPPLGVAVVADGIARFTSLVLARERNAKEWVTVVASSFDGHVVVCGAGRVGYRVATQLHELGRAVVVIEKRQDAAFVASLIDRGIPVLFDDIRSRGALERANIGRASAIAAVTDDDLANLNVSLDARRLNAGIRLVLRLFDEDLMATVRQTLGAEALSTSALAAPQLALAALDPAILHSFRVGSHLMVVGKIEVSPRLSLETVKALRDVHGALTLSLVHGAREELHPPGTTPLPLGAELTLQAEYADWQRLRDWANA